MQRRDAIGSGLRQALAPTSAGAGLNPAPAGSGAIWAWVIAGFAAVGLLSASVSMVGLFREGEQALWLNIVILQLVVWGFWGAVAPIVLWVARRYPLERGVWRRHLPVHLVVGVALAVSHLLLTAWVIVEGFNRPTEPISFGRIFMQYLTSRWQLDILVYAAMVGAWQASQYLRRLREREMQAARLEAQLARAQLHALEMQLHPHFLFNTLQAISTLVSEDPPGARRMLALLGDLLRAVLDDAGRQVVPLRRELEYLTRYLEIERTRFPDRLSVQIDVPEPLLEFTVPNLLLQPLVENAIKHGVAPRAAAGTIEVHAALKDATLQLTVRDDGTGTGAGSPVAANGARTGVGLANTRARLQQLYGENQRLSIVSAPGRGTTVTIEIPAQREVQ